MNIDVMRIMDRHLGLFICRCLATIRPVSDLFSGGKTADSPRRILIIKLSEMGSTVFAQPAFSKVKERAPDAELYMLVFKKNTPLVRILELVPLENVIEIDTTSIFRFISSSWSAILTFRKAKIDAVIDMDLFFRISAIISFLTGSKVRVGFHRFASEGFDRGCLLTHKVAYSTEYHTATAFMALAESLFAQHSGDLMYKGIADINMEFPVYNPPADATDRMKKLLISMGVPLGKKDVELIVVAPESASALPCRKWPSTSYVKLCGKILSKRPGACILITGAPEEKDTADSLSLNVNHERCFSLAGKTDLTELMCLYSLADALVANDGGPAHFAAMCGLPSVVMFGPETPRLYSPVGGKARCLYAGLACSPCLTAFNIKESRCKDNVCMQVITVEEVLKELNDLLSGVR